MRLGFPIFITALVLSLPLSVWAKRDYRAHGGYLNETAVVAERLEVEADLVVLPPLPPQPTFNERVFNEKLSKEFRDRYEQKFGRTDAERIYYSPNRTTYYNDMFYRGSPQELNDERRKFGDYMIKRLAEYHAEDYMKNDPRGRTIYAIKERVSNVGVSVQKFRFDARYEIAGNTFDLIVKNPYLNTARVRLQMNQGAFGPGPVEETIVTLGKEFSNAVTVESYWVTPITRMSFVVRKALSPNLSANISALSGTRDLGARPGYDQFWITESVYLMGMNFGF